MIHYHISIVTLKILESYFVDTRELPNYAIKQQRMEQELAMGHGDSMN